jgi:hypothetical protein
MARTAEDLSGLVPGVSDPATYTASQRQQDRARADLEAAQAMGANAYSQAEEAARLAAVALNAATDSVRQPPPPPDREVAALETTSQWVRRQFGDYLWDPVAFWDPALGGYERERTAFDVNVGFATGLTEGLDRYRHRLFTQKIGEIWLPPTRTTTYEWITLPNGAQLLRANEVVTENSKPIFGPDFKVTARVNRVASVANRFGIGVAYGTSALDQWVADRNRQDLSGGERVGRIAMSSLVVGSSSVVGGWAGAKVGAGIGAAIGSMIPGVGTVAGGIVGGIIGGIVGSGIGQTAGNKIRNSLFGFLG